MSKFVIEGDIIGEKDGIPIVDDSSIKKASHRDSRKSLKYHLVESVKPNKTIRKSRTKKLGFHRRNSYKKSNIVNNQTPYAKFNAVIKQFKSKDERFNLSREEKSKLWQSIKKNMENGSMRPTKKEMINFIRQ